MHTIQIPRDLAIDCCLFIPGCLSSKGSGSALWYSSVSFSTSSEILKDKAHQHIYTSLSCPQLIPKNINKKHHHLLGEDVNQLLCAALLILLPLFQESSQLCLGVHTGRCQRHSADCQDDMHLMYIHFINLYQR